MSLRAIIVALAATILTGLPVRVAGAEDAPLLLERKITLTDVPGRLDHMAFDAGRKRLLVSELGNGSLEVIDVVTGRSVRRINGLDEPQGVAYAPAVDAILVANGGDGTVRLFHGADFAPFGSIDLGDDADNVVLDHSSGNFIVGFGSGGGGLAVIDPVQVKVAVTVPLPAHPEAFRLDPDRGNVFVNVPEARQIAVVDLRAAEQVDAWRLHGLRANYPMALDPGASLLATVFRTPPHLVLLDPKDGRVIAQVPTCDDSDDLSYDARRQRLYVSCGAGVVDVFRRDGATLLHLAAVKTAPGARTSLFVPAIDRLFVAARAPIGGATATILEFRPLP